MSEITDLAKIIREDNEKARDQQERIASGEGPYAKETVEAAKISIKKQDEQRVTSMKILGISEKRMAKAEDLTNQIQAQEQIMAEQKSALEESGVDAEKVPKFQEEQIKLDKLNAQKDKTTGAAASEDEKKAGAKDSKMMGYLKQTAGFLGGIAKQGMQKVKSGLSGFSKFLFGALAVAALAFLDHPKFKEMISLLIDTLIPLAVTFYEEVLVPVGAALAKLFKDIMGYLKDGKPSLMSILMDNKLAILGIITALAPGLVFGALKLAVMGIGKAVVLIAKSGIFAKIGVAFTAIKTFFVGLVSKLSFGAIFAKIGIAFAAIKTFFVATLFPFLAAWAVPAALIIAAVIGVAAVLYGLKKSFDDFMFELEATGSVWEAIKTAFISFFANGLGIILNPIKDGISWVIGKIGSIFGIESFTNASKAMDDFDFVEGITELMTFVGDYFAGLWQRVKDGIQDFLRSSFLGGKVADKLFGTVEEQATEKKIEEAQQKRMVEDRKALREKQKLEKEIEEAKKAEKLKVEQNALQPKAPAMNPIIASRMGMGASAGTNIVSAPTSIQNSSSSSNTTTSTPVRQPNMVIGLLAAAG